MPAHVTTLQKIVLESYRGGEFSHITSSEAAEEAGELLLAYLLQRFSAESELATPEEAIEDLEEAVVEIENLREAFEGAAAEGFEED